MNPYALILLLQIPSLAVLAICLRGADHLRLKHAKRIIHHLREEKKAAWLMNRALIAEQFKNEAVVKYTHRTNVCCTQVTQPTAHSTLTIERQLGHDGPCFGSESSATTASREETENP